MITAVVAANKNLEMTKSWYEDFRKRFPDQLLTISCINGSDDISEYIGSIESSVTKVFVGKANRKVSFSECYNASINLVETDKFVLVHNDMQFCESFFEILDKELEETGRGNFIQYITYEPPVYVEHKRDGKIIRDWNGWEDFNSYVQTNSSDLGELQEVKGGFFRAGWTEDIQNLGGFDQTAFEVFCEDDDLVLRTMLEGYHTLLSRKACVYHFVSKTTNTLGRGAKEEVSCRAFYVKWGILPYQVFSLPLDIIKELIDQKTLGIVSSFDEPETNYLKLQRTLTYE